MTKTEKNLYRLFPPSPPCSCSVCRSYCSRPGWWIVAEAKEAIAHGYAGKMMLEISPGLDFGVLSPAFKGNEGSFALQIHAKSGCTFYEGQRCSLFGKPHQPLECRFCRHDREGQGQLCHRAIEKDWNTSKGKRLVELWLRMNSLSNPFLHPYSDSKPSTHSLLSHKAQPCKVSLSSS